MVAAIASALTLGAAEAQAPANVRVALVIGNAAYAAAPLTNAVNDSRAIGRALRDLGFQVIEVNDASKDQMASAIEAAKHALDGKYGIAMFYYAGHGMQLDWRNYLIPVDAKLQKPQDVLQQTVDVDAVMAAFKAAKTRMSILVLDACRDNPFASTSSGKGLAPVDAPPGTFLAYATAPGNVALDGSGASGHGLYTQYLLEELKMPKARIEDVFKRVRINVRKQSGGLQIPWESTSLEEDFSFGNETATIVARPVVPPETLEGQEKQKIEFEAEKVDWNRIRESANPNDYFAYMTAHPNGYMSEQAQFRLDQLQKPVVAVQPKKGEGAALKSGARRFELGDELEYERDDRIAFKKISIKMKVTAADDKYVTFNTGVVWDQMGSVIKDRFGTRDPGLLTAPADLEVGKKWRSAFEIVLPDGGKWHSFWDSRAVGLEEIAVPAGRFMAFKVERAGLAVRVSGQGFSQRGGTLWIDPKTMYVVRNDMWFTDGAGRRTLDETTSLVSSKQVAR
ncbi:caspase family protein [Variovorax sp. J22R24]|uniref:caspase family protein n=1 Tax=Variovorax gracilis TaxID=3053502 RepID=UPI002577CAF6|nr:caspase family protein [Variovorax sp. J22R24]MDM0109978.1 caspase family protein [Variovorax sp. J22R24]